MKSIGLIIGVIGGLGILFYGLGLILDLTASTESIVGKYGTIEIHKKHLKGTIKMLGISLILLILGVTLFEI